MIHIPHVTGALPVYLRMVEIPVRSELQFWMLLSSNYQICVCDNGNRFVMASVSLTQLLCVSDR